MTNQCPGTDKATGSTCVLFPGHVGAHVSSLPTRQPPLVEVPPSPAEVRAMFNRLSEVDRALFAMGLQHRAKFLSGGRWLCGCGEDPCPADEPKPIRVCGECGAHEGKPHGMTHERHPQGGGGTNRQCSRAGSVAP